MRLSVWKAAWHRLNLARAAKGLVKWKGWTAHSTSKWHLTTRSLEKQTSTHQHLVQWAGVRALHSHRVRWRQVLRLASTFNSLEYCQGLTSSALTSNKQQWPAAAEAAAVAQPSCPSQTRRPANACPWTWTRRPSSSQSAPKSCYASCCSADCSITLPPQLRSWLSTGCAVSPAGP